MRMTVPCWYDTSMNHRITVAVCLLAVSLTMARQPMTTITPARDDTVIRESCRIIIPVGMVIEDVNNNGVIHVEADDITLDFVGGYGSLRGSPEGTPYDAMRGIGIRIDGRRNVRIQGAGLQGFKVGIWATNADGLVIEGCDVSVGFAQRLRSTPRAEDVSDWLWPHRNDNREWMDHYGAGIYIERSGDVTIRSTIARRRQNGIVLDRVTRSAVYDNDCSFLSGWGLAMWRSGGNMISRNAFDFCVRGYSHGVYNRGQDSAGILLFEQCSDNVFAENSVTHGGDGIFAFAGREALGEVWLEGERARLRQRTGEQDVNHLLVYDDALLAEHARRGNNNNLFIGNDLSYAPAHGLELTFSFGNRILGNRFVENAICGVWGGYSQDTLIAHNTFERNGQMAYGLERGGVNIEHGRDNIIARNEFHENHCGVHLWWDPDGDLALTPWAKANGTDSRDNLIAGNRFTGDHVAVHLRLARDANDPKAGVNEVTLAANDFADVRERLRTEDGVVVRESSDAGDVPSVDIPKIDVMGRRQAIGARDHLRGRANIVMLDWFPWDHESPLIRRGADLPTGERVYEVHGFAPDRVGGAGQGVRFRREMGEREDAWRYIVWSTQPGVHAYTISAEGQGHAMRLEGVITHTEWDAAFFSWREMKRDREATPPDDLETWRALAKGPDAVRARVSDLRFVFGSRGPSDLGIAQAVTEADLGRDLFGMIAHTKIPLGKGLWRITTRSDDGVRVIVNGETIIENWTHHGPTTDTGEFTMVADGEAEIIVEHFEIFGYAVLEFDMARVR